MRFLNRGKGNETGGGGAGELEAEPRAAAVAPAFPPDAYEAGVLPCARCGGEQPLHDLEPLRMTRCPECKTMNFVPMRLRGFWLFQPQGGGGMGSVYKAYAVEARDELFAVKVLFRSGGDQDSSLEALMNEAKVGKVVGDHPNLVKCVESGYEGGEYFFAMEFVDGKRLDNLIRFAEKLCERHVVEIALDVLAAERNIYDRGYLYRDMKPENVIVTPEGRAVVFDYGLCMAREDALRSAEEYVSGSPYYMPPERLWGTGEDAYSEIYSLGMLMYNALTGRTFFDSDEVESLAKRHVSRVRLTPASKMRGFRSEVVEVLSKMIKQDREERYQTFDELERALRALHPDLPVSPPDA